MRVFYLPPPSLYLSSGATYMTTYRTSWKFYFKERHTACCARSHSHVHDLSLNHCRMPLVQYCDNGPTWLFWERDMLRRLHGETLHQRHVYNSNDLRRLVVMLTSVRETCYHRALRVPSKRQASLRKPKTGRESDAGHSNKDLLNRHELWKVVQYDLFATCTSATTHILRFEWCKSKFSS